MPYLARGLRGREVGVVVAKADPERGGHRPKKGLLRGGKNRKEEGYVSRAVEKVAADDGCGGVGQRGGWRITARRRRSEETHGSGSAVFVAL